MRRGSQAVAHMGFPLLVAVLVLSGCAQEIEEEPEDVPEAQEEPPPPPEAPKEFFLPTTCNDILSPDVYLELTVDPVALLRGPGSGSPDPVYQDPSPQEELGGISCFFGDTDETRTYTLSIAPIVQENRAGVIAILLEQDLNVDQTASGALIYSIQGDDASTPATYNTLHPDGWYEVLVSPGGRLSYEQAEKLARAMREHTYR
jgi:hypothetical protein